VAYANPAAVRRNPRPRDGPFFNLSARVCAVDELHHACTAGAHLLEAGISGDVGVIQRREQLRFALQAGEAGLDRPQNDPARPSAQTSRKSFVSRARSTTPIAPSPSWEVDFVRAKPGSRQDGHDDA